LTRSARPTGALTWRGSWARRLFAEAARDTAGKAADDAVATRKFRRLVLDAALSAAGGLGAFGMTFLARFRSARRVTASRDVRNLLRTNKACDGGFREHPRECGQAIHIALAAITARHFGAEPTGPDRIGRLDDRLREEPGIYNHDW
jgi:hypothetical protein